MIFQQIIDRASGFIFPIIFFIINVAFIFSPIATTESQGINTQNYLENYKQL